MKHDKWESFFQFAPLGAAVLFTLIQPLTGFSEEFTLFGFGLVLGISIFSLLAIISRNSDELSGATSEDVRALREAISDVRAKTDVIYGNMEEIRQAIARIDVRTERIHEIDMNISNLKVQQQGSHAREENDVLTSYINAFLTEYGRLKAELDESKCNAAYLSKENASLSCRIRTLNQLLEQQKTENNFEEKKT